MNTLFTQDFEFIHGEAPAYVPTSSVPDEYAPFVRSDIVEWHIVRFEDICNRRRTPPDEFLGDDFSIDIIHEWGSEENPLMDWCKYGQSVGESLHDLAEIDMPLEYVRHILFYTTHIQGHGTFHKLYICTIDAATLELPPPLLLDS